MKVKIFLVTHSYGQTFLTRNNVAHKNAHQSNAVSYRHFQQSSSSSTAVADAQSRAEQSRTENNRARYFPFPSVLVS